MNTAFDVGTPGGASGRMFGRQLAEADEASLPFLTDVSPIVAGPTDNCCPASVRLAGSDPQSNTPKLVPSGRNCFFVPTDASVGKHPNVQRLAVPKEEDDIDSSFEAVPGWSEEVAQLGA